MNKKKLFSLLLAIMLIVSSFLFVSYLETHNSKNPSRSAISLGPRVNYLVYDKPIRSIPNASMELSAINNTTTTIQVFGTFPGSKHVYLLANSSLQFLNGSLFLSSSFYSISDEWASFISQNHINMTPSLTVESYQSIYMNGKVYVYSFYNNIPFDPYDVNSFTLNPNNISSQSNDRSVQASLAMDVLNGTGIDPSDYSSITLTPYLINLSISFSGEPQEIINSSNFSTTYAPASDSALESVNPDDVSQFNYYTHSYATYDQVYRTANLTGPFPLAVVHMSKAVANGNSQIDVGGAFFILDGTMGIESSQVFKSISGDITTTMSSNPSYIHNVNATSELGLGEHGHFP
ncbi:hypothetical protein ACNF40_01195 [Cuniculiplasma sp. SKW4]|uniref:hypothetical protein n=1 Tax=Cuniculiplasma sp. SKW4 TaxID=3400171 RepID=UPI003FD36F43